MTLVEQVKPDILTLMQSGNRTYKDLERELGVNYYTVRQATLELVRDGEIVCKSYPGTRNMKYGLRSTDDFTPNPGNTIPRVIISGKSHRVTDVLGTEGTEPKASTAAKNFPHYVARLCTLAERFNEGDKTAQLALEALQLEMNQALQALEAATAIYKQTLRNRRNWNPDTLSTWVTDPAYDPKKVKTTHEYFNR